MQHIFSVRFEFLSNFIIIKMDQVKIQVVFINYLIRIQPDIFIDFLLIYIYIYIYIYSYY
jgi:hypothetical protein